MINMNHEMEKKIAGITHYPNRLPADLDNVIKNGFIEKGDAIFSKKLYALSSSVCLENFQDHIAYECFVNSLHIDDYVEKGYLEYAVLFTKCLLDKWAREGHHNKLTIIISLDEFGCVVKFHLEREGEHWLDHDLEGYSQPVLVTNEPINLKLD